MLHFDTSYMKKKAKVVNKLSRVCRMDWKSSVSNVSFQKILNPPCHGGVFGFNPTPLKIRPLLYFQYLGFQDPEPPQNFCVPLCRGCGYYLELHKQKVIVLNCCFADTPKSIYQEKKTKCGLDILLTYYMELPNT